jgi:hypothetical protein
MTDQASHRHAGPFQVGSGSTIECFLDGAMVRFESFRSGSVDLFLDRQHGIFEAQWWGGESWGIDRVQFDSLDGPVGQMFVSWGQSGSVCVTICGSSYPIPLPLEDACEPAPDQGADLAPTAVPADPRRRRALSLDGDPI